MAKKPYKEAKKHASQLKNPLVGLSPTLKNPY
jgi:hypothetical protein